MKYPSHIYRIDPIPCASCVQGIEEHLENLKEIQTAKVHLAQSEALVTFCEKVDDALIIEEFKKLGYHAQVKTASHSAQDTMSIHLLRAQMIISILCALPLLASMFLHLIEIDFELNEWAELGLASVVQLFGGIPFYSSAFQGLKRGSLNMNTLVAIGTSVAYLYSLWLLLFTNQHAYYFETSATLIAMILLGRFIEERAKMRAMHGMHALLSMQSKSARIRKGTNYIDVPIEKVEIGDLVQVRPGEKIPIDGKIVEGASHINESMLTGESAQVYKHRGDPIFAGALNGNGSLEVKVSQSFQNTKLSHIIDLVQKAQNSKAPIARLADHISAYFIPFVVGFALITFFVWWLGFHSLTSGILNAIAVLVIACPCALGLATPIVIMVGTTRAAKETILIKDATALEKAYQIQGLVIDKTGTITSGELKVVDVHHKEAQFFSIAKALSARSEHPLSQAVHIFCSSKEPKTTLDIDHFLSHPGQGVEGHIQGKRYLLGSANFIRSSLDDLSEYASLLEKEQRMIVCLASQTEMLGFFVLEDSIKKGSEEALSKIKRLGIRTFLLSGDRKSVVQNVARKMKFHDFKAEVLPEEKAYYVKEKQQEGFTIGMMGDGVNDAIALAQADIGFAVGHGTDVAMENAQVGLMQGDLLSLYKSLKLSKLCNRKIKQNLFFAFIYNLLGIPFAALGYLNPMLAGALMALSSISVVLNALLLQNKPIK